MSYPVLLEMDSKNYERSVLASLEHRQLVRAVQAASRARRPQRQRLPKTGVLRKLVISMGHSAP